MFSIITATKNPKKDIFIKNLQSVNDQIANNFEHLIVDGSDKVKIDNLLDKNNRIQRKVFYNQNNGIYSALNYGIKQSRGKYIILLHSDDKLYCNDILKKAASYAIQNYDILIFGIKIKSKNYYRSWKINDLDDIDAFKCKLPPHTGLIVKKKIYEKLGVFNESYKIASDIEFMIRIFNDIHNNSIKIVNDYLVQMHAGGASTNFKGILYSNIETYKVLKKNKIKYPLYVVFKKIIQKILQLRFSNNFER